MKMIMNYFNVQIGNDNLYPVYDIYNNKTFVFIFKFNKDRLLFIALNLEKKR